MRIFTHRNFDKAYIKLRYGEKSRFKERRNLFLVGPFHPALNNHALKGKYTGYRSINIGGDLRTIFKMLDEETAIFMDIDTHPNLYE